MMEGGANFESFTGAPGGQEATKESQEKFQEQYRKQQAAAKKAKKEEGKKKQQDNSLASIILQFLGQTGRTGLFILISRLVSRNIPSDVILAIIALVHAPAQLEIQEKILTLPAPPDEISRDENSGNSAGASKTYIDIWTKNIATVCYNNPRTILKSALDPGDIPTPGLTQLYATVLREYLENNTNAPVVLENLVHFADAFFKKIFIKLREMVGEEYILEGGNDDK